MVRVDLQKLGRLNMWCGKRLAFGKGFVCNKNMKKQQQQQQQTDKKLDKKKKKKNEKKKKKKVLITVGEEPF